jgi:hypothetical protein
VFAKAGAAGAELEHLEPKQLEQLTVARLGLAGATGASGAEAAGASGAHRTMTAGAAGAAGEFGNCTANMMAEPPDESNDWFFLLYHTLLHLLLMWLMMVTVRQWCQLRRKTVPIPDGKVEMPLPPLPPPVLMPEQISPPPPVLMPEQISSGHGTMPTNVTLVTTLTGERFHLPGCVSLKKATNNSTAKYFTACASCVGMRYPTTQ